MKTIKLYAGTTNFGAKCQIPCWFLLELRCLVFSEVYFTHTKNPKVTLSCFQFEHYQHIPEKNKVNLKRAYHHNSNILKVINFKIRMGFCLFSCWDR